MGEAVGGGRGESKARAGLVRALHGHSGREGAARGRRGDGAGAARGRRGDGAGTARGRRGDVRKAGWGSQSGRAESPKASKMLTGERCAGDPYARFGGRGGANQCAIHTIIFGGGGMGAAFGGEGAGAVIQKSGALFRAVVRSVFGVRRQSENAGVAGGAFLA